jgi:hypothetical protein
MQQKTAVLLPAVYHHKGCRLITRTAQGITAVNYSTGIKNAE